MAMPSTRQQLILRKVVEGYMATGAPVGSKLLAVDADLGVGSSTIRNELALLEEQGLLSHPHTSAGRVPTDAGYRYFVDHVLPQRASAAVAPRAVELTLARREVAEAMRMTTETLSQVTNLLAIVTAPPIATTTIRHVEVLALQPQVLMVVIITSTGGVSKRVFAFESPVDPGLAELMKRDERMRADETVAGAAPGDALELPQLLERVDADVRVRPDADAEPALAELLHRREAVAEVGLGRRAGTDPRASRREQVELVPVGVRCVHDGRARAEATADVEQLDRAQSVLGEALLDLAQLLVGVDV